MRLSLKYYLGAKPLEPVARVVCLPLFVYARGTSTFTETQVRAWEGNFWTQLNRCPNHSAVYYEILELCKMNPKKKNQRSLSTETQMVQGQNFTTLCCHRRHSFYRCPIYFFRHLIFQRSKFTQVYQGTNFSQPTRICRFWMSLNIWLTNIFAQFKKKNPCHFFQYIKIHFVEIMIFFIWIFCAVLIYLYCSERIGTRRRFQTHYSLVNCICKLVCIPTDRWKIHHWIVPDWDVNIKL
jgi:hypothetical protein